ncbi:MAG: flagellin [Steroidobacteraceae bacterium]
MALTLNTNIDSIVAQNNLNGSQSLLSQSLTRLSSGLRINSAADDAAGLAISQQFTTQINGTNQAINNANDAVSEAQTTAGALTTIVNNLQSIRTLAVESANGSNSASDRSALNSQVQQQIAEITQIAQQTTFNGLNVLNGSSGTTVYQVGANVGDTIAVSLQQGVAADQIGQYSTYTTPAPTTAAQETAQSAALTSGQTVSLSDGTTTVTVGPSANFQGASIYQGADSAFAKAAAINGAGLQGLTASASTTAADTAVFGEIEAAAAGTPTSYSLTINGTNIYSNFSVAGTTAATGLTSNNLVSQINLYTGTTGVSASVNTTGNITLSNTDGSNIVVSQTIGAGATAGSTGLGADIAGTVAAPVTTRGSITLTDSNPITVKDVGAVGGSASLGITLAASGEFTTPLAQANGNNATLANQDVLTVADANSTIASVDAALATVSAFQSQLGAIQNRFTSAVSNLQSTSQNLTQSRSTIQDANFAQETANLTQAQVLEQAGISVLAQANQEPQLILKLLQ